MDNVSPSPPKRPRTIDFLTSQAEKQVQYLPFNRRTPDISNQEKLVRSDNVQLIKKQNIVSSSLATIPFSSKMKFVPNKEANISNKLQKLKLKSPDGRDLGEINVQLLPQKGDGIGGKTIMLQKHSLFGKLDNSSTVSILKPVEKTKQITISGPSSMIHATAAQRSFVNNGTNCVSVNTIRTINTVRETGNSIKMVSNEKQNNKSSPLILRQSDIQKISSPLSSSKVFYINVDKQSGLNTVQSVKPNASNSTGNQKIIVVHAENYPDTTEGKKNNDLQTSNKEEMELSTSNVRSVFWNPSKYSDMTTKLNNQKSKLNENRDIVRTYGNASQAKSSMLLSQSLNADRIKIPNQIGYQPSGTLQRRQKPKLNSWTIVKTSDKKYKNGRKNSSESESSIESSSNKIMIGNLLDNEDNRSVARAKNILYPVYNKQFEDRNILTNTQNESTEDRSSNQNNRENIMVVVHEDTNNSRNNTKANQSHKEIIGMAVDADTIIDADLMTDGSLVAVNENMNPVETRKENLAPATVAAKQQDLDIIQKALSSLTDPRLRNVAMKALANCGIGVKRDVPIPSKVTVSDSDTQTQVFSLLEPGKLVEYSDTCPILNQLNIIHRSENSLQHFNDPTFYNHPLLMNKDNYFDMSCNIESPSDTLELLDEFLIGNLPDDLKRGVDQVKDAFHKPNPIVSTSITQIEEDLRAARNADGNGMMGIHRAVLNGNIKDVQRQIIVLQAVKESIDVTTADGKTSLELAVLNDVDPKIIRTLISAGAKPAFPTKLHESALIIASRTSSPVLWDLIEHVTPSTLLDMTDSEGFAPIHYCAQLGNTKGVQLIVSAGADVNLKDHKSGRTALFHALEGRNVELAWYLIEHGALPNIVNFAGQSPSALVDEFRHQSLIEKFNQSDRK